MQANFANADVAQDLNRLNYDPSFHRTRVRWTFTKQGEAYAAQASDKVLNLPAPFNDTNTAYGTGARPIVSGTGQATGGQAIFANFAANRDIQFVGIQLQSPWDATTDNDNLIKGYRRPADDGDELFVDCVFDGLEG